MKLLQALLLGLFVTGCATDPVARLEAYTPALSPAQVAQLRKRTVKLDAAAIGTVYVPETVTLPLLKLPKQEGGAYRVPVLLGKVGDGKAVRLLLDTGSNQNLLGYRLATSLQIPIIEDLKPVTALAIGGTVDNYPALVPTLSLGSLEFHNLPAFIGPDTQSLSFTRNFLGNVQAMIISLSAFKQFSFLTIDTLRGTVTIAPHEPYAPAESSRFVTDVSLRWENGLPVIDIAVDRQGSHPCVLDTGGDYGLLLPRERAAAFGYWKPGRGSLGASSGVGGAALDTSFVVRQVKVGGATLEKIPARVILVGPEPGSGRLMLGNVVLRRYRVTFDFRRGRLWLER